jgi:hypothetical protein
MSEQAEQRDAAPANIKPAPQRVRLPGFIVHEEIGLGDVIKHATRSVGIKPCGGCEERARRLNRLLIFTPRKGG